MAASWPTVTTVWIGTPVLAAAGAAFGLLTLAEARSAPAGSFGGTSWVGAAAELSAGWALIGPGGWINFALEPGVTVVDVADFPAAELDVPRLAV